MHPKTLVSSLVSSQIALDACLEGIIAILQNKNKNLVDLYVFRPCCDTEGALLVFSYKIMDSFNGHV